MTYQVSTLIHRPLEEVFRFVTQVENQAKWQAATVENTQLTPGLMRVGAQMRHSGKWLGRTHQSVGQVEEYEPNQRWAYKSVSGPYDLAMHYRFEAVGEDT